MFGAERGARNEQMGSILMEEVLLVAWVAQNIGSITYHLDDPCKKQLSSSFPFAVSEVQQYGSACWAVLICTTVQSLLILFMQDKTILNEFAAKITKAKLLHDSTQAACQKLRREAAQLEKEYHTVRSQREAAENMEKSLKNQLALTQNAEKETAAKCRREEAQLEELRENRKKLKREKEIEQHTLLKNKLELQELVTKRQQLQATAKALSEKLEGVTSEKEVLQEEYNKTQSAIKRYNENIAGLNAEIEKMRDVITTNTVPVYHLNESQLAPNPSVG